MSAAARVTPEHRHTPESVRELFGRQQQHRWQVSGASAQARRDKLERLRAAIRRWAPQICDAVHQDFAKPHAETQLTELVPTLEEINHALAHVAEWMAPRKVPTPLTLAGATSEVRYEAKGVVLILSPWNYPFYLSLDPVIAAVAAGNCVVLRPSEKTPHTARVVREVVAEAFPEDEVAVVLGGRDVADALLDLPFDHIFFTGSPAVGRKVMTCAAKNLVPVTLELGGKSPVVVDKTARVAMAAERIAWGKFINGGQTCVAPDYALVHESVLGAFVSALKSTVEKFYGATDAARLASTDFCKIVDTGSAARLEGALKASVAAGAKVELGGQVDVPARRVAPTVLTAVTPEHAIMQDEIFGPILPILSYRSLEEALELVRSRPKPLALYVFSEEERVVEQVLGSTTAGGSCVNNVVLHLANPNLPFGGVGGSGMGHYHGHFGFETFSHARAVLHQKIPPVAKMLYPPYSRRVEQLLGVVRAVFG